MTDHEKAVVMAYTGICMLNGEKFSVFHKYIEDLLCRPVYTHELGALKNDIKEASKKDFIALCENGNDLKCIHLNVFDDPLKMSDDGLNTIAVLLFNYAKSLERDNKPELAVRYKEDALKIADTLDRARYYDRFERN